MSNPLIVTILAHALAAGYSLNGLWRIVERSIVWTVVRRLLESWGLGVGVLLVVVLFGWKLLSWARVRALGATERAERRRARR